MAEGGRKLRCMFADLVEKIADAPDEDSRIPQISIVAHFFGAGAIKKDFTVKIKVTSTTTVVTISAAAGGVTKTATLTVKQR